MLIGLIVFVGYVLWRGAFFCLFLTASLAFYVRDSLLAAWAERKARRQTHLPAEAEGYQREGTS